MAANGHETNNLLYDLLVAIHQLPWIISAQGERLNHIKIELRENKHHHLSRENNFLPEEIEHPKLICHHLLGSLRSISRKHSGNGHKPPSRSQRSHFISTRRCVNYRGDHKNSLSLTKRNGWRDREWSPLMSPLSTLHFVIKFMVWGRTTSPKCFQ